MQKIKLVRKICLIAGSIYLPAFGCVTTNQLKDFIRTEIAIVGSQVIAEPINDSLAGLTGPQVVEEIVPAL